MGRVKLQMELISSERKRNKAFKRRREGLITKIQELTTLCDVSACMIIYYPAQDKGATAGPDVVWPKCPEEVQRIIEIYKAKDKASGCKKFGLRDFVYERTKKAQEELAKLRKQNLEAKYPAHTEIIDKLSEAQLRVFAVQLKEKAEFVRSRVQMLKMIMTMANQSHCLYNPELVQHDHQLLIHQQNFPVPVNNYLSNNCYNQYQNLNLNDLYSQFGGEIVVPNAQFNNNQLLFDSAEMQWAKLNQNGLYSQFGGEIANASPQFSCQIFCDQTGKQWVVDPMVCETAVPLEWYNEHVRGQASSSTAALGMAPPQQQLQITARENDFGSGQGDEFLRQQMH